MTARKKIQDLKKVILSRDFSPHSPHSIIPSLINEGIILDVGCNAGFLGEELIKKNVICDGIDVNHQALEIAKKFYRKLYMFDLSKGFPDIRTKYDYIVLADILEHLPNPAFILKESTSFLKPKGKIIISLPNVARLEIRLKLLLGNFDYEDGILSRDHLRFFTFLTAKHLIKDCGLSIEKIIPTGLAHIIKIFPTLTAFQFVFVCSIP